MDTKAIAMDYDIVDFGEQLVPVTVRLPENVYFQTKELSERFSLSFASVARIALEAELENYLGTVKYIDKEQAEEIRKTLLEILDNCRKIYNEANRIGVNYNQEIRLKNAEAKYEEIKHDDGVGVFRRNEAKAEYEAVKSDVEANTYFSKEEAETLLIEYKNVTEKMQELVCRIPQ